LRISNPTSHISNLRRFIMPGKLVVVGGGAGGPSAAAKAKRVDPELEVTILEGGEHVSFST
jgi:NADPH-dependent 2,4-dienoyl-CoA reductase/sulfur reductase-like enzyme